jgi:transcriptional regulator with XRE-family HTH domain
MIPGRLRECLKILRWSAADVAEQLGCPESGVTIWLDGRAVAPIAVAAWLEALVKAHKALPLPSLGKPKRSLVNGPIKLTDVDIATRIPTHPRLHGITPQCAYPRRGTNATGTRRALPSGQRKEISSHATHPL